MNIYGILDARLVAAPEKFDLKSGKSFVKARLADNPPGKKDDRRPARFVNAKFFGAQGDAALRLSKGDVISAVGELELEAYKAKDGTDRTADTMAVNRFRVQKSETFWGPGEKPAGGDPGAPDDMPF